LKSSARTPAVPTTDDAPSTTSWDPNSPGKKTLFATLLTGVAGFLDAVGYAQLGGLYVSFMSGNSVHLGMALANKQWPNVLIIFAIIGSFVLGAATGTAIGDASSRYLHINIIAGEFLLFLVAIALTLAGHGTPALAFVSVALGMQNVLRQRIAGTDVGKSFITGALFALGESLARLLRGRPAAVQGAENALSWISFVSGAALGTVTLAQLGLGGSLTAGATLLFALGVSAATSWL